VDRLTAQDLMLRHRRLSRSRPLWEMWFLPGLPDRRVGLFMKVHHTIADGGAGIAVLGAFVDPVPDPPCPDPPPWSPAAMPTTGALFVDNLRRVAHAHDATVNDVLMAALAGGLRALLMDRGERVDGLVLRAAVPVSLHQEQPGQARGNRDGMMVAPAPGCWRCSR
jgi:wax ester synthase-like acyl-CoA acyltransferase family protein